MRGIGYSLQTTESHLAGKTERVPRDEWVRVKEALRQLGVSEDRIWRVKEARIYLEAMSSTGAPSLPDFTLHNYTHSDNVILLLARLQDNFEFELSEYEAYLLTTSAYFHDLGMFFSSARFQHDILPNLTQALRFCPNDRCDQIDSYRLEGRGIGQQIRETHHLLSAYMILNDESLRNIVQRDDLLFLIAICRGHRKANLRERGCTCYQSEPVAGDVVRIGFLAALLRLADALDFRRDRV
jgi:hypothetical protein